MLDVQPVSKTKFTMVCHDVNEWLKQNSHIDTIIICGIETHVCVHSTVIDLLNMGYKVHILVDATASRTKLDRSVSIECMKSQGAHIATTEGVILRLLSDKNDAQFKKVQNVIKDINPLNAKL